MANQYVNKLVQNGVTRFDLTGITVSPSVLLDGETAVDASGAPITGEAVIPTKTSDLTNDSGFITSAEVESLASGGNVAIALHDEDLNDLKDDKVTWYYGESGNTCAHKPTATTVTAFSLVVLPTSSFTLIQILINNMTARQFRRYYNRSNQTWGSWTDITINYNASATYAGLMSAAQFIKLRDLSASTLNVTDTHGICGTAGATVTIQALMDAIAAKV